MVWMSYWAQGRAEWTSFCLGPHLMSFSSTSPCSHPRCPGTPSQQVNVILNWGGGSPWQRRGGETPVSGCYTPFETTLGLWKGIIIRSRISLPGYLATSRTLMKQDTELVSFNEGGTWERGARIVVAAGAWISLQVSATLYDGARLSDLEKTLVASVSKRADRPPPQQPRNHKQSFLPHRSSPLHASHTLQQDEKTGAVGASSAGLATQSKRKTNWG